MTDSLNLDSMLAEAEAAVDADDSMLSLDSEFSADELQAQLDELSDLSVLDSELEPTPQAEVVEPSATIGLVEEDSGTISAEGLDQPINLDAAFDAEGGEDNAVEALALASVDESTEPVSEDEVATKLDLARAYVEMGDEDGARSILEEVMAEGNPPQRADAETLLEKLG
jgi:pilus assembly protein FimV